MEKVCTECIDALALECRQASEWEPALAPTSQSLHFRQSLWTEKVLTQYFTTNSSRGDCESEEGQPVSDIFGGTGGSG